VLLVSFTGSMGSGAPGAPTAVIAPRNETLAPQIALGLAQGHAPHANWADHSRSVGCCLEARRTETGRTSRSARFRWWRLLAVEGFPGLGWCWALVRVRQYEGYADYTAVTGTWSWGHGIGV